MLKTPSMQDMLDAGVHFGHQVRRGNPKMFPYLFGARDGVHIIDLAKSEEKLKVAVEAAYKLGKEGKVMLIIGTKKQARAIIEELSKAVDTPYLTSHWVGGLLTNFDEIKKNLDKLGKLKEEKESGTLAKTRTKKEQLLISKKLEKTDRDFGGLTKLDKVPDALFIADCVADFTAVKEANRRGVTTIGVTDSNANPAMVDFPIPGNDDGIKAIKLMCTAVIEAYGQGKKEADNSKLVSHDSKNEKPETSNEVLDAPVAEEAAVIEEEVEKELVEESSRAEGRGKEE